MEEQKNTENQEQDVEKQNTEAVKKLFDPEEQLRIFTRGEMTLERPIRAASQDVEKLFFDFSKITGREYIEALDADAGQWDAFHISRKQALSLFAKSAAKETPLVDYRDVMEGLTLQDVQSAIKIATVFYNASARVANKRLKNV